MKYVLRDQATGRFLKRPGQWVIRLDDAMTFSDAVEAREYCQAHRLENVQPVRHIMPSFLSLLGALTDSRKTA